MLAGTFKPVCRADLCSIQQELWIERKGGGISAYRIMRLVDLPIKLIDYHIIYIYIAVHSISSVCTGVLIQRGSTHFRGPE